WHDNSLLLCAGLRAHDSDFVGDGIRMPAKPERRFRAAVQRLPVRRYACPCPVLTTPTKATSVPWAPSLHPSARQHQSVGAPLTGCATTVRCQEVFAGRRHQAAQCETAISALAVLSRQLSDARSAKFKYHAREAQQMIWINFLVFIFRPPRASAL